MEETLSHARRCIINERMYSFIDLQEKEGVVFNIVGEVLGLVLDFHFQPMHQLSERDKARILDQTFLQFPIFTFGALISFLLLFSYYYGVRLTG